MRSIFAFLVMFSLLAIGSQAEEQHRFSEVPPFPSQLLLHELQAKDICEKCRCCKATIAGHLLQSLNIKKGSAVILKENSAEALQKLQKSYDHGELAPLVEDSAALGLRDFCERCGCCNYRPDGSPESFGRTDQVDPTKFPKKYHIYWK